jgi:MFS family permease
MPLRMFRSRNVAGANVIQFLMVGGLFGMFVLGALYMQGVLGYSAVETGLAFLPVSVGIGVLSVGLAPRLTLRFGPRAVLIPSLTLLMIGLALFSRVTVDGDYVQDLLPTMLLFGIGAGMSFPALMTLAMSGASPSDAGLASGMVNTTLQVGGALGLAVLATLATSRTDDLRADGEGVAVALTEGYQLAFSVGAALLAAAIVLAVIVLKPAATAPQEAEEQPRMEPAYSET